MLRLRYCLLTLVLTMCALTAFGQDLVGPGLFRLPPTEESPVLAPAAEPPAGEPIPEPAAPSQAAPVEGAEAVPQADNGTAEEAAAVDPEMLPNDNDWWFFPASWYKPFNGSIELGLNGTDGNSQTFNVRAGAKATYELPWVKHTYEMLHIDNSSDGVQTALNGFFDGRIVFPFEGTKWSLFVHQRTEYDDFRDYNSRLSADGGLAYDFWNNDKGNLQARFGASTSRELGGVENEFVPEVTGGLDLTHKFDDRQSISIKADYYPSVEDFNNYRINSQASWEMVVSKEWGLSTKLSVIDRYDSTPNGRKPNDINYAALLLWAF